jgi:hypothetical protein
MKTRFTKLIPIVFISLTLFLNVGEVEGKSAVAVVNNVPELWYNWTENFPWPNWTQRAGIGNSWITALNSVIGSITYKAILYDDFGSVVSDGDALPIGKKVHVVWNREDSDITWNGTGYSADSPIGTWRENATDPPDYCTNYYVNRSGEGELMGGWAWDVYVPLSVHPPVMSVSATNASCVGNECTITGIGPVSVSAYFPATYGKFYYRYFGLGYGNDLYLTVYFDYLGTIYPITGWYGYGCYINPGTALRVPNLSGYGDIVAPSAYSLPIPAQTITFNLTAVSNNNPPTPPTITGVSSANLGTTNTFTFNATDIDGDTIKYEIDWNNDGVVDGLSPTSGFVSSGSNSTSNYTLPSTGTTFTFKARTADSKGGVSAWTTKTVTLLQAINGTCGAANGTTLPSQPTTGLCINGTASSITTNPTTWTWTCSGTNGGNPSPTCTTTKQGPTVNVYFSLLDRVKLFTINLISEIKLIDRVLAKEK